MLLLIKGLLLPLTGFNEELEVKDKQTNSDSTIYSRLAMVRRAPRTPLPSKTPADLSDVSFLHLPPKL